MPDLKSLQHYMKDALVSGGEPSAALLHAIGSGTITNAQRIRVHQNNYRQSLVASLAAIFPVAQTYVGEPFLKGAASRYIAAHPPAEPMLAAYGATFAAFMEAFPPVAQVPYLPDIMRLEWAVHELQVSTEQRQTEGALRLSANARVIASAYPLLNLWMAGTGQIPPEAVNVKSGGQCAAAVLRDGEVRLMALNAAEQAAALAPAPGTGDAACTDAAVTARLIDMGVLAGRA